MLGSREPVARQPVIQQCTSVPEDVTSVQCSSVLLCVVCYNFVSGATDLALFTHVPIYIPEYVSSCFRIGEFLPIGESCQEWELVLRELVWVLLDVV